MKIILLLITVEVYINLIYQSAAYNSGWHQKVRFRRRRASESNDINNPCNYTAPIKPNFSAPNRRISEVSLLWRQKQPGPSYVPVVIGGRNTETGEFPHMGAIGWRAAVGTWIFKCGSSLISSKFLLTAAHCSRVSSSDASVANPVPEIVRLGDKNIIDVYSKNVFPQEVRIKRIINHPNFKPPKKYFDVALIELVDEVVFTRFVQPACLCSKFNTHELGKKAIVTGWGIVETAGKKRSPELQAAVVDIINSNKCDNLLRRYYSRLWCGVESHQMCAGKLAGGIDACQGDSGEPLQVKIPLPTKTQDSMYYVIGVTSFGIGCALPNLPGMYTRVSSVIDWIEDIVWRGLSL
ncbi:unnamed protein product [Leptosia nina]|uniref:Peptidase S1 domain-containing protein n=1 Tax=Leptosia nina TaxID=320188 RepID=A0AAV1J228_9NEOP